MLRFLVDWLAVAFAVVLVVWLLPGVEVAGSTELALGALFTGLLNAGIRPAMRVAMWPITMLTYGCIVFTVNGLVFALAGPTSERWQIASFRSGLVAVMAVSFVSWLIGVIGTSLYQPSV